MGQARAVALRAQVVARTLKLVLGATMGRAGMRLLLLRDGHAGQCNRRPAALTDEVR